MPFNISIVNAINQYLQQIV